MLRLSLELDAFEAIRIMSNQRCWCMAALVHGWCRCEDGLQRSDRDDDRRRPVRS